MAKAGAMLDLGTHQVTGFFNGDICPECKLPNIIFRSWRNDYLCGQCFAVYDLAEGNIRYRGNQKDLD